MFSFNNNEDKREVKKREKEIRIKDACCHEYRNNNLCIKKIKTIKSIKTSLAAEVKQIIKRINELTPCFAFIKTRL